ncbi:hypothetical protein MM213_05010 [Belliella sp. R4-6]|uniref:Uncharacterized protein n=1 Tax=Belliella alkalica TaxID=1730871 RepID=A0ABS9V8T7_9BACT|nr:hypothetical protein [Belliella alkalica]MCH7412836.1 hypothetical protein [Belliella alkalica]
MANRIFSLTTLIILISICDLQKVNAQYKFEKNREFQIKSLNSVEIVDYDPVKQQFLAYEKGGGEFVVVLLDDKGRILQKKDLNGQGPGQFSSAMNFLGFSDTEDIRVITPNQMISYDRKLNFKESKKFVIDNPFFVFGGSKAPVFYYKNGQKDNLVFTTYPSGTSRFMREKSLEKHHLIEMHELNSKKTFHLVPIAHRPIFKHLDNTINSMYKPIFTQDKKSNQLYVTASLDNEITVFDLQSGKTISNIKINHGDFGSFKKFPISDKDLPSYPPYTLASMNLNVYHLDGGLVLLDYVKEIPYGTFEKKKKEDAQYHHFQDPDYHRVILFDERKQLSNDMKIPYGQIKIAMPNNSILIKLLNPDEEEDFVRYGVYQVSK